MTLWNKNTFYFFYVFHYYYRPHKILIYQWQTAVNSANKSKLNFSQRICRCFIFSCHARMNRLVEYRRTHSFFGWACHEQHWTLRTATNNNSSRREKFASYSFSLQITLKRIGRFYLPFLTFSLSLHGLMVILVVRSSVVGVYREWRIFL